jgi:N-acetylmuramoyl-L-alanine amidase
VLGGVVKSLPASAAAGSGYRTITSLKLRAKASTSGKVLLVMPGGALVKDLGTSKNGFIKVEYQGTAGWAYGDYLAPTNSDLAPPITGEAATTSSVNFRQGPDLSDPVIEVLKKGTWVETSDTVVDGYRHVRFDGTRGWIFDDYLGSQTAGIQPGQTLTVTSALNLREMPNTSSKVFTVMPQGAQVTAMAQSENGFRLVYFGNIGGWAYEDYLA